MTGSTPNSQRDYQRRVLAERGFEPNHYDQFILQWWRNPTNHQSMRLTKLGFNFFVGQLKLPVHRVTLSMQILPKQLIQLERQFKNPYFIEKLDILAVFSEEDAIMLQLHAGNLAQYLDNLQSNT